MLAYLSLGVERRNYARDALFEIELGSRSLGRTRRVGPRDTSREREQGCLTAEGEKGSSLHLTSPVSCARLHQNSTSHRSMTKNREWPKPPPGSRSGWQDTEKVTLQAVNTMIDGRTGPEQT